MSETVPLIAVGLACALYALGAVRLWRRAGRGRGRHGREAAYGLLGFALLIATLLSPLHRWSEALLSAHMIEHEILMTLAAPLLILGNPLPAMLWAFPSVGRRMIGALAAARPVAAVWRLVSTPLSATALHGLAIWAWHMPAPFAAALASEPIHWLQHASFLLTALIFWSALLRRAAPGPAIACLFITATHTGLLGALLTVSPRLWYPVGDPDLWGLSALEDQQLAGLVMWIPGGLVYVGAALGVAARWISPQVAEKPTG